LFCFFRIPSLGISPIAVRGGKIARGTELSKTVKNKKERENRGEVKTIHVLLAAVHFHRLLEISRHRTVRILTSWKKQIFVHQLSRATAT